MSMFEVSTPQLAAALGLTPRRVQQLVKEGLPQLDRGKFNLTECVRWYYAREAKSDSPSTAEEAEIREKLARAEWHELRTARLRGQLLAATDVERTWDAALSAVSAKLDNLAGALPPKLMGMDNLAAMQAAITRAVEDCKAALRTQAFEDAGDDADDEEMEHEGGGE